MVNINNFIITRWISPTLENLYQQLWLKKGHTLWPTESLLYEWIMFCLQCKFDVWMFACVCMCFSGENVVLQNVIENQIINKLWKLTSTTYSFQSPYLMFIRVRWPWTRFVSHESVIGLGFESLIFPRKYPSSSVDFGTNMIYAPALKLTKLSFQQSYFVFYLIHTVICLNSFWTLSILCHMHCHL